MNVDVEEDGVFALTADIVSAYVRNNSIASGDLPAFIGSIHAALRKSSSGPAREPAPEPQKPAVPIKKSVMPDHIVCLEDVKKFKSLRRHLKTAHGLTPAEYRKKWGLEADYPIVAPEYAATRSALAKSAGLGSKRDAAEPAPVSAPATTPRRVGRPRKPVES
jgi:predicted transcriptional regulator